MRTTEAFQPGRSSLASIQTVLLRPTGLAAKASGQRSDSGYDHGRSGTRSPIRAARCHHRPAIPSFKREGSRPRWTWADVRFRLGNVVLALHMEKRVEPDAVSGTTRFTSRSLENENAPRASWLRRRESPARPAGRRKNPGSRARRSGLPGGLARSRRPAAGWPLRRAPARHR